MGNLAKNLREGKVSYGFSVENPEQVELVAHLGLDFASMNMHSSPIEWHQVAHMCTACQKWGISGVPTIQMNPWVGEYDPRLSVDSHKSLSIGASAVIVSVHGRREVEELMEVSKHFWPRTKNYDLYERMGDEKKHMLDALNEERMIIPKIESQSAWDNLESILSVPGLRIVFIAFTDTSRILGVFMQYDHPKLWDHLKRAIDLANKYGVAVMSNPGFETVSENCLDVMTERANRLVKVGVKVVSLQSTLYLIHAGMFKCVTQLKRQS